MRKRKPLTAEQRLYKNAQARKRYAEKPELWKAANKRWMMKKGYGVRKTYHEEHIERYMLSNARVRAKEKGWDFNITLEDIVVPEYCPVLGIKLQVQHKKHYYSSPSLDRIHSDRGYIKGNVRVISWRANNLRSNGTLEEFEKIMEDFKKIKIEDKLKDWESSERVRPPWVPIAHGKTIKPPNEQFNPQPLTNEMVLQPRDEPVGINSMASPINGRGQDKGMSETSNSKQTHSDSGARNG